MKTVSIPKDRLDKLMADSEELSKLREEKLCAKFEQELKDNMLGVLKNTMFKYWPRVARDAFEGLSKRYPQQSKTLLERLPSDDKRQASA